MICHNLVSRDPSSELIARSAYWSRRRIGSMRVTDDRYWRDRRAFDLAWRLLGRSARTSTISRWTGLAERRIRALQRSYGTHSSNEPPRRPRGRSPQRVDLVLRSPKQRHHAARLACIYRKHTVLPRLVIPTDACRPGSTRGSCYVTLLRSSNRSFHVRR